jgi:flagellar biosynthetic protein FlhB
MAESGQNRTERATPKRKEEARRKGQIALSRDAAAAAAILGSIGLLYWMAMPGVGSLIAILQGWLTMATDEAARRALSLDHVHILLRRIGAEVFVLLAPFMGGIAVVGIGANLAQTGFLWRREALQPDITRLNPITGFSRLCSLRALTESFKALLKIAAIGGTGFFAIRQELARFPELTQYDLHGLLLAVGWITLKASLLMACAAAVIGVLDYAYQRYEWERSLRMTKEEIREEQRESEGDPMLRARVRTVQKEMARRRMMTAVPTADVVVTNPTELAVALQYKPDRMAAPIVVAKGAGFVAARIREIARQHGIPIVENKPVARALFKLVEIDREVPADLYRAVAEILAFVYRVRGNLSRRTEQEAET